MESNGDVSTDDDSDDALELNDDVSDQYHAENANKSPEPLIVNVTSVDASIFFLQETILREKVNHKWSAIAESSNSRNVVHFFTHFPSNIYEKINMNTNTKIQLKGHILG